MASSANEKPTSLKLKVGTIINEARYEVFKAFKDIEQKLDACGINLSDELETIQGCLLDELQDVIPEIRELIEMKCREQRAWKHIRFVDCSDQDLMLDYPDSWPFSGELVTCKKCFVQYDGNGQHICE